MSLPKVSVKSNFLKNQKLESLLLPGMVLFILAAVLLASFLIPKRNQEQKDRDISVYTASNKVKVHAGKTLEVAPIVKQIPPELLSSDLAAKGDWIVVQVFSGEEWRDPHIKGSVFMKKSDFDSAPANIDKGKNYVY